MPCRIEFTIIGMTVTDWSFTFRCSPPHLAVTQFLQVTTQSTFGLDRTFTFLFHNPHRRTGKLARERSRWLYFYLSRARAFPTTFIEIDEDPRRTKKGHEEAKNGEVLDR